MESRLDSIAENLAIRYYGENNTKGGINLIRELTIELYRANCRFQNISPSSIYIQNVNIFCDKIIDYINKKKDIRLAKNRKEIK